jgi:hypothetical protein
LVPISSHIEDKLAAGLEHAAGLPVTAYSVRKKHDAELTYDDVKAPIFERQRQRVDLLECHAPLKRRLRGCAIEHRLIEIARHDVALCRKL